MTGVRPIQFLKVVAEELLMLEKTSLPVKADLNVFMQLLELR